MGCGMDEFIIDNYGNPVLDTPRVYAFEDPNAKFCRGITERKQQGFFLMPTRIVHMNKHWENSVPDDVQ